MPQANGKPEAAEAGAQPGVLTDPHRAYNFKLEIQGATEGHFTKVSGMGADVQVIAYREAGQSQVVRRLPGRVEYGEITLHYGLTQSTELWEWFTSAVRGSVERKHASIVLVDADGVTELLRWNLFNAWPSKWRGAPLDAMSQEVAIESLTLVFESLERG